jgi:hypothetical protein
MASVADCTHLLILRVADDDTAGPFSEVRVGVVGEPDDAFIAQTMDNVRSLYESAFGRPPERAGSAVLPWCAQEDEESEV